MNHDEVTSIVSAIAVRVAADPDVSSANFPLDVFNAVRREAPQVIKYLEERYTGQDPHQALKWFLPSDLGYSTS